MKKEVYLIDNWDLNSDWPDQPISPTKKWNPTGLPRYLKSCKIIKISYKTPQHNFIFLPMSFCNASSSIFPLFFFLTETTEPLTHLIEKLFPLGGNIQPQWLSITPLECINVIENTTWIYRSVTATNIKVMTLTGQSYRCNYTILLYSESFCEITEQIQPITSRDQHTNRGQSISSLRNSEKALTKSVWQPVLQVKEKVYYGLSTAILVFGISVFDADLHTQI